MISQIAMMDDGERMGGVQQDGRVKVNGLEQELEWLRWRWREVGAKINGE